METYFAEQSGSRRGASFGDRQSRTERKLNAEGVLL